MLRYSERAGQGTAFRFNPHPLQRAGATGAGKADGRLSGVSILTRSKERVLRSALGTGVIRIKFQSSPAPKSGCYVPCRALQGQPHRFNPHPLQRAGATSSRSTDSMRSSRFNPHPLQRAGATSRSRTARATFTSFNPHPLQRAGATPGCSISRSPMLVSILTRSKERVLQNRRQQNCAIAPCFNPHPLQRAGATVYYCLVRLTTAWYDRIQTLFQSSPAPKSGCYSVVIQRRRPGPGFQSSPAPKSGCYQRFQLELIGVIGFNPHPLQRAGATLCPHRRAPYPTFQSSPAPKSGCYKKYRPRVIAEQPFQSSPAPKSGCYTGCWRYGISRILFQSSPAPKSGCYVMAAFIDVIADVSILTRSKERVLREDQSQERDPAKVSILTRSKERVLRADSARR